MCGGIRERVSQLDPIVQEFLTYGDEQSYDDLMNSSIALEVLSYEARTEVLKALSDPIRLEILDMLSPEIRCNCHFQERLDLAPNLLSYHLKILRDAGLIEGTKRGRWVDYALTDRAGDLIQASLPRGVSR